jgi:hypothetical protein
MDSVTELLLFSTDKGLLNLYFNELQLYYRVTYGHERLLPNLKIDSVDCWNILNGSTALGDEYVVASGRLSEQANSLQKDSIDRGLAFISHIIS